MATETKNLIVVFKDKDEMFSNQLRKLIDSKDDNPENSEIIGTEDGSIKIVAWSEKQWLSNKGTVDTSEKILFLGEVKGTDQLIPVIDEKYNKYGVIYGWAANQAIIYVDSKALKKREVYNKFLEEMKEKTDVKHFQKEKKIGLNKKTVLKGIGSLFLPIVWPFLAGSLLKDAFDDMGLVRDQQYLFGIFELYRNHLESFMNN